MYNITRVSQETSNTPKTVLQFTNLVHLQELIKLEVLSQYFLPESLSLPHPASQLYPSRHPVMENSFHSLACRSFPLATEISILKCFSYHQKQKLFIPCLLAGLVFLLVFNARPIRSSFPHTLARSVRDLRKRRKSLRFFCR